jgi:hypothetical protein
MSERWSCDAAIGKLFEAMFSIRSVPRLCNEEQLRLRIPVGISFVGLSDESWRGTGTVRGAWFVCPDCDDYCNIEATFHSIYLSVFVILLVIHFDISTVITIN